MAADNSRNHGTAASGAIFSTALHVGKFLLLIALLTWLLVDGTAGSGYNWQWYRIPKYFISVENLSIVPGPLLKGVEVTLLVTLASLPPAFFFGLAAALSKVSGSFMARMLARVYIESIRNTPLLVQILFTYFVLGPVFGIGRFHSAVLALSLFEGAYIAEIFRSGIVSIPDGQWEAARSSGLSVFDIYRHVILPQAVRRIIPPLTGQAVSLVKDSALVSTIAIYDLTMQGQAIVAETFLTFEIWFTVAAVYLTITLSLSFFTGILERRLRIET
jgi:polar amino acid transport system permease protein